MHKIKVIEAVNQLGLGGTEYALQLYCKFLDKDLFDVTVIALNDGGPRVELIQKLGINVILINRDMDALAKLLKEADVFHWHGNGLLDPELFEVVRANKPKLVIQTNVFGLYEATPLYDVIDYDLYVSKMILVRRMNLDKNLIYNFASKRKFLPNPVDVDHLNSLMPTISAIDEFKVKHKLQESFIVGRIGRADDNKFDLVTLDGFAEFTKQNNAARFLLLGATPKMLAHAKSIGIIDKLIIFENTSDLQQLLIYYKTIDIFLAASSIGESFGMVIAEAMAVGTTVITISTEDRDNAQIEVVDNNKTGLVVKPNKNKIAAAIQYLKNNSTQRAQFSLSSKRKVELEYKADKVIKSFEQMILNHFKIPVKNPNKTLLLNFSKELVDDYSNRCANLHGSNKLMRFIKHMKSITKI